MAKKYVESIPVGSLAIVALSGSKALGNEVDMYIKEWRKDAWRLKSRL